MSRRAADNQRRAAAPTAHGRDHAAAQPRRRAVGARRDPALGPLAVRARDRGGAAPGGLLPRAPRGRSTRRCSTLYDEQRAGRRADGHRPRCARWASSRTIGGQAAVDELTGVVPAAGHARRYAQIVRENALLRRLLQSAYEIQESVLGHDGAAARARRAGREGDARGRARRPPAGLPRDRGGPARGARQAAPALARGHLADRHPVRASRTSTRSPAASSPAT